MNGTDPGLLADMAASSADRLAAARTRESERDLLRRAENTPPAPPLRLSPERFDIIAECKLRSPSAGDLSQATASTDARVAAYARGGACAVSVLTEPTRFGGVLSHLADAARALAPLATPVMRKDFLIDPYQVMEARTAGAGGVLLIARMLDRERLGAMLDCAAALGLFVLLEAFDAADLALMQDALNTRTSSGVILVGLNCRDLDTLAIDVTRFAALREHMPHGRPWVAESGIVSDEDASTAAELGYELALVGSALMGAREPEYMLSSMLAAGRRASSRRGA